MPSLAPLSVSAADVAAAHKRVAEVAWRTPLVPADRDADGRVHVKLECLQRTGSFKIRGAWNRMRGVTPKERDAGFVTVSAGNHGQAVAWCARRLDAACTVWVPEDAVARKVEAMEAMGADIRRMPHQEIMESMTGDRFADEPQTFVHPFGEPAIIAGQGTIGLEILDDLPETATVLVPVGGGGLATGIATAVKAAKPEAKVYGVQAANAAPLVEAIRTGKEARVPTPKTIADGIAASIAFDYMAPLLRDRLDGVITVTEDELRAAVRHLALESHVVAEAAGAASLAAAHAHLDELDAPVVCVISGGNIAPALLGEILGTPSS